jgi:TetR/AcrR family transcriptional regulator
MVDNSRPNTYRSGRIRMDNEQQILKAAEEEFASHGFKGVTMNSIAARAGIPRTNVHYYFKNKLELYVAVLTGVIDLWNEAFNQITPDDNPADALGAYIRAKVMYSKSNPQASKIFASEIIHGAPNLKDYLKKDFGVWLKQKADVIGTWASMGKMDPVDPFYLIFLIWGATQYYADFEVEVCTVLGKRKLSAQDYDNIAANLTHIILKGCGIKMQNDPLALVVNP